MDLGSAEKPREGCAGDRPRRAVEVRLRLPAEMVAAIDGLIAARFIDRAEAIRGLLYSALKEQL